MGGKICTMTDIRRGETVIRGDKDGKEDGHGQRSIEQKKTIATDGRGMVSFRNVGQKRPLTEY
jgi:hypothetical protein